MIDLLTRFASGDLEVRSDGRTVAGIVCPYDSPTPINEWGVRYTESFARGAFAEAIAKPSKVKFLGQHDRSAFPLGTVVALRDDAAGLYGEFKFSKTRAADDALELARDGAVDGFSVGFRSVMPAANAFPKNGEDVVRQAVHLSEVSLVTFPAYNGARVTEIRSELEREFAERLERMEAALEALGIADDIEVDREEQADAERLAKRDKRTILYAKRIGYSLK